MSAPRLTAQENTNFVTDSNATGVLPYRAYGGARENIDLRNLNVQVLIPLLQLRGRSGFDLPVSAAYNSIFSEWVERVVFGETKYFYEGIPAGGSGPYFEIQLGPELFHLGDPYPIGSNTYDPNRYIVRQVDGTRQEFQNKDYDVDVPSWVAANLEWMRSTDGSFAQYRESSNSVDGVAISKSGVRTTFAGGRTTQGGLGQGPGGDPRLAGGARRRPDRQAARR